MNSFLTIFVAGVFSCIALDLFGRILLTLFKIPEPSWGAVGRWVFYIFRRGADHPLFIHGQETLEAKSERSARLAELREIEAFMFKTGLATGARWRGRKPH